MVLIDSVKGWLKTFQELNKSITEDYEHKKQSTKRVIGRGTLVMDPEEARKSESAKELIKLIKQQREQ